MKNIDKIYREIIMNGYYDEAYGMKSELIDGKMHGVCIDFSIQLIEKLKKDGYSAGLISTLNDDGFLHAAVLYRNMQSGELSIADPVTDIRRLTDLDDNQRRLEIKRILGDNNWCRDLKEYIEEFGAITEYYDNMSKAVDSVVDKEKLESHPSIIDFEKRGEQIQTLKRLSQLTNIADGPTLLACQTLYKKGIDTFCTNYDPKTKYTAINIRYNSLSDENKEILQELLKSKPDNYVLQADNGFYGELSNNNESIEIREDKPMQCTLGFYSLPSGMTETGINFEMNNLAEVFKKQEYLQDVYTREDILSNKHHHDSPFLWSDTYIETPCSSTEKDSNEQMAINEGLLYSAKYNMFFRDQVVKSRYIESLYREEHDWRTEQEIAQESGIFYSEDYNMFFENEKEAELYAKGLVSSELQYDNEDYIITPTDIAKTSKLYGIGNKIVQRFKAMIEKVKEMWR